MTDTISRADALAAIEAVVHPLSGEIQYSDALAAINALPAVSVTEDVLTLAVQRIGMVIRTIERDALLWELTEDELNALAKAALETALMRPSTHYLRWDGNRLRRLPRMGRNFRL